MTLEADDGFWEVYALRYARKTDSTRGYAFLLEASPAEPFPADYYFWLVRQGDRKILIDTGYDAATAQRRTRTIDHEPADLLRQFGVDPDSVETVIITHLHYDHAGSLDVFRNATFHVQEAELHYATGRAMRYEFLRWAYDVVPIRQMVDGLFTGRVEVHDGDAQIAPGVSVHRIDGHTIGLQSVAVNTRRGKVVIASDAASFHEHLRDYRISPAVVDAAAMLEGYDRLRQLADSMDHIIPSHDPRVGELYPKAGGGQLPIFRLDEPPLQSSK